MDENEKAHHVGEHGGPGTEESSIEGCGDITACEANPQESCSVPISDDAAEIARLAALSSIEYDRARMETAKRLKVRATTIDTAVKAARGRADSEGTPFQPIIPWPEAVDPAMLLTEIANTVKRFVFCNQEIADAVALWTAMTHVMDVVNVAPLLIITAPEKRCGKTLLLSLVGKLAARPILASNITPAALFRSIEKWTPTILLDECDAFMKEDEGLRGIINSGHTRESAFVIRTVGDEHEPTRFSTWSAKAFSGIGRLPGTLEDRAVIVELRRKLTDEKVDRIRDADPNLFDALRRKLTRWAEDFSLAVKTARPPMPPNLNDRAQDNWEPLLAIATTAGDEWLERATKAALKLSVAEATLPIGAELLSSIQNIFAETGEDRISTAELIALLIEDTESPWPGYNRGNPITPRQVANRLKEYGIFSRTGRFRFGLAKGYLREQFEEAFSRYVPAKGDSLSVTALHSRDDADLGVTLEHVPSVTVTDVSVTSSDAFVTDVTPVTACYGCVTASISDKSLKKGDCYAVTDRNPLPREEDNGVLSDFAISQAIRSTFGKSGLSASDFSEKSSKPVEDEKCPAFPTISKDSSFFDDFARHLENVKRASAQN